jgi:hypothetical protein
MLPRLSFLIFMAKWHNIKAVQIFSGGTYRFNTGDCSDSKGK